MDKRSPFTYSCWKGNTFKGSSSQNNDYMQIFLGFLVRKVEQSLLLFLAVLYAYLFSLLHLGE